MAWVEFCKILQDRNSDFDMGAEGLGRYRGDRVQSVYPKFIL